MTRRPKIGSGHRAVTEPRLGDPLLHRRAGIAFGSRIAWAAFFLMFPGYFAYHMLVDSGYIPPVLAGYSTGIAALLLPVLLPAYVGQLILHVRRTPAIDPLFALFIAYFLLVVLIHVDDGADASITGPHFAIAVQFLAIFTTVRLLDISSGGFRAASVLAFMTLTSIVLARVSAESLIGYALDAPFADTNRADYQGYAFVYLVTTLFCAVLLRPRWSRLLIYVAAIPALFLNGARSEFVAFLFIAALIEWCFARRRSVLLPIAAICVMIGAFSLDYLSTAFPDNRVISLVDFGLSDGSIADRRETLANALLTLENTPVLGAYASYPRGDYAHNILSVWVDLGLFGFLLFSTLLLLPFVDLMRQFNRRSREPEYVLALSTLIVSVLLFITAKNFTYQILPVALGLYSRDCFRRAHSRGVRARLRFWRPEVHRTDGRAAHRAKT